MSFIVGTLSGAVAAGGVYYAFSNLIKSQTDAHRADMHALAHTLIAPPASTVPAPLPAAARIARSPVQSLLAGRWNEEIEGLFRKVGSWEKGVAELGRRWLYGGER
ncbi:hypothetical protein DFH11DRAFT_1728202 [Phellopilus nigrolimitatus]|nr:hypothetical protein DFH11DRAFT_1728202 [Phellopilus nigrolimitatus]